LPPYAWADLESSTAFHSPQAGAEDRAGTAGNGVCRLRRYKGEGDGE